MSWHKATNAFLSDGSTAKVLGIDHPCLLRRSARIYQLLDPKKPEHSDIQTFDVGQVKQFVLFDKYLRTLDLPTIGPTSVLAVPSGYKDFASLFNRYNKNPERFATFERRQDGVLEVSNDGSPVDWSLFKIASSLVDGWPGSEWTFDDQQDVHQDGSDGRQLQFTDDISDDTSYVLVERTESEELLNSVFERMKGTVEVVKEINNFYHARAEIERNYSLRLAELSETISAHHATGELLASLEVLGKETATQSTVHRTLLEDVKRDLCTPCEALITASGHEIREAIMSAQQNYRAIEGLISQSPTDSDNRKPSIHEWSEWVPLVESCQKMEEMRLGLLKDSLWAYANLISTACVADDESAENVRVALEKFEPTEHAQNFSLEFGSAIKAVEVTDAEEQPVDIPVVSEDVVGLVEHLDGKTDKFKFYVKSLYDFEAAEEGDMTLKEGDNIGVISTTEDGWWLGQLVSDGEPSGPPLRFPSNFITPASSMYKFFVKSRFDYLAIDETDMTMKAGDVIGVIATSNDGWWEGELLSGDMRSGTRRFPSNFVTFQTGWTE